MLWSLLKIVVFVALVAALTLGAGYLMESEGGVQLTVAGTEFTFGPLQSVLLALALVVVLYVVFKLASLLVALLKFINGDETALSRFFDRNRERKGYQALSEAIMALASGEGRLALAKAGRAEKYLRKPELTDLISAQAAEMQGDAKKAEEVYKRLLQRNETRFVGVRGLMKQKLALGDTETALKLAERAFAIKPKHDEVQDTLLRLQAQAEDYTGARQTLAAKLKYGALPRDVFRRRDAVLALSEAQAITDDGESALAAEKAIKANKNSPDLIPAAAMAARSYAEQGRTRNAISVLKKAWTVQPHPDLAAAFAAIEPNETPAERVKRFGPLLAIKPEDPETKMLRAELMIAAEDFPAARRAMGDLAETDPTKRSLTLMAAIERGEGADEAVVRAWLAKALTAAPGPQWVCEVTGKVYAKWVPYTDGGFDTLTWKRVEDPIEGYGLQGQSEGLLPLIVGALEDKSKAPDPAPEPPARPAPDVEDAEIVEPAAEDAPDTPEAEPDADADSKQDKVAS